MRELSSSGQGPRHVSRRLTTICALAALFALVAGGVPALAQDATPTTRSSPLVIALAAIRDATPADRDAAVARALALKPAASVVAQALYAGLPPPATTPGWSVREASDVHGVTRPYHLYVPAMVAKARAPAPMLVDLHGGVNSSAYVADEKFRQRRGRWQARADADGFVLVLPKGRRDSVWWRDAGVAHIRAVIRDAKRHAPIDDDAITATGFSDGGSGCWYLAMSGSDPFAALMPMNGSPHVAIHGSERQLYLPNAATVPLFVAMTQDDPLYPGARVLPFVQELFTLRASVHLVSYPTGGHTASYLQDLAPVFGAFVRDAQRDPLPAAIDWQLAQREVGTFRWAEVLALGASVGDGKPLPDVQVEAPPDPVRIGIRLDTAFPGPGLRALTVQAGRPAASLGLVAGDVILAIDGVPATTRQALRAVIASKQWGDLLALMVHRDGQEAPRELSGTLPTFRPAPSFPRSLPTAHLSVRAEGNHVRVTSHGVRRFRLLLSPTQFDLGSALVVIVNGVERSRAVPPVDLAAGLRRFAHEADAGRWFPAQVDISLPAAK